jgi:hypothetical protein
MKRTMVVFWAALIVLATAGTVLARADSQNKPVTDQQKAMEEAVMKAGAVTENHALLKPLVGKWNGAIRTWDSPTAMAQPSQGSSEAVSLYDGRFVMEKFKATMMNMPFQGMSVTGYDNLQKEFCLFWIDNNSTAFFLFRGTYDAVKKAFTYASKWTMPMGQTWDVRMVIRVVSPDEHVQEMYVTMPGQKEYRTMEIVSTRVKGTTGGN